MEQKEIKTNEEIKQEDSGASPDVNNLKTFESENKGTDLREFEGQKATIENVEIIDSISSYDETGHFKEGLQRPVKKLKVQTGVVTQIETPDGKIDIKASELFNMVHREGMWGISSHEKASIQKFMKRQKVKEVKELIGTQVIVKAVENKDGKIYLGFITE